MKKRILIILTELVVLAVLLFALFLQNKKTNGNSAKSSETTIENTAKISPEYIVSGHGSDNAGSFEVSDEAVIETAKTDPDSPEGRAAELGLPAPPDIDISSWEYLLVNAEHSLDETYVPELAEVYSSSSSSEQDARIADALTAFVEAAEAEGLPVYLSSGYRSYETQNYLFEEKCEQYDRETAATIVAPPGTSEHQTGLSCDITDIYRSPKNSELEDTDTYKWMSAHCAEYGFIVRYPNDKNEITGIIYEPWHFRYVGVEAASYITENNLTLEEFVALYAEKESNQ